MDTRKQKPFTPQQGGQWRIMIPEWWRRWWCQRVWRGIQLVLHWPTGIVSAKTALLDGFRLLGQIQLLQPLHGFQHQSKPEVKSLLFSIFAKLNLQSAGDIQPSHKTCCRSVIVDCQTQTNQNYTAICRDRISSFWNHLLKWVLAIDRKFLHSLRVYYRSEHSHRTKAETPWDGPRLQQEQHWES